MDFYNDIFRYSDNIAITDENGTSYTYGEMLAAADDFASQIPNRSLIFLVCENCSESIMAYIGCLRRKIVPVLIHPKIDHKMLHQLLGAYRPQFIFCPQNWHAQGVEMAAFGRHHLLKTGNENAPEMNPDLAVLITTSGSTGSPKLVMQSYKNIISNANSIAEYLDIQEDDRAITTMPMSYTYGLSIIQSHLIKGARIIATEKTLMDKMFWKLFKEQKATTFGGVPYVYEMLKQLRFERMELPSLRYITQAGGKLSKDLTLEFSEICRNKGIKLIIMYGQTEATARMSYLPWEYAFSKAGSIGIAIPHGRLYLADVDGREIMQPGIVGEMVYEGDNVTLGYALTAKELKKADQRHGRLETGDMAVRDSDGFFTIVGRKKRFLKIFGNRVNLDEAEGLLNQEGFKCVCGGRDDQLKVYIVDADENKMAEAVDFISAKAGLNRSAFQAVSVDEIPRNNSGKVMYSKLEEIYG